MALTRLTRGCEDIDGCPAVFRVDGHTDVAVIGEEVTDPELLSQVKLAPGERLVTLPAGIYINGAVALWLGRIWRRVTALLGRREAVRA